MKTIKVVAAVIKDKDRIFATARGYGDYKGWWEFPGGKRVDGESASAALHREIKEELNIPIYILKPITNITDMSTLNRFVEIRFLLCFCLDSSNIQLSAHSQIMWVPYTQLSQINNMYPVDAVVIDNVIDQVSKIMNQGDYKNVK